MASHEALGSVAGVSSYHIEVAARALAACLRGDHQRAKELLAPLPPAVLTRISLAGTALSTAAGSRIWNGGGE